LSETLLDKLSVKSASFVFLVCNVLVAAALGLAFALAVCSDESPLVEASSLAVSSDAVLSVDTVAVEALSVSELVAEALSFEEAPDEVSLEEVFTGAEFQL